MKVNVTLMALIKRPADLSRIFSWDVEENTKIKIVLADLGYNSQEIRLFQLYVTNSNGEAERITKNYILQENDEIFVTIPVGGG
ncbi:MAG: hypothetical protein HeimC2_19510 [Candidatus Heimdallarchaeota archaeon LC_2]|nr:MAG: hypothetical protein HeimC2_19510 [Candidatus Heimdallarchaeota archaeon LC_2]